MHSKIVYHLLESYHKLSKLNHHFRSTNLTKIFVCNNLREEKGEFYFFKLLDC